MGRVITKLGDGLRWFGALPLFEPREGRTVIEPPGAGKGWWVGAPSAIYDPDHGGFLLYYRVRKPRELGRGGECRIAASPDGMRFKTIWSAAKEQFQSDSIERSALVKCLDGKYRLYVSFVDPADRRWRTDVIEADRPDGFDPARRVKVFTASDIAAEGVKDPVVLVVGRRYCMILSYAPTPKRVSAEDRRDMHGTADVYNTGVTKSHTGLAVSNDGVRFQWLGDVLSPQRSGWDSYAARIGSVLYTPPVFLGFYDGSASVSENYEEKTGLAQSFDLRRWERLTVTGPALTSPHASGALRYIDALPVGREIFFYYEYARPDGSHELRLNRLPWG
jgi:hypothetical protein